MAVLLSTTILSSTSAPTKPSFNHVNGSIRETKPSSFPGLSLDHRRHSNRKFLFVSLAANNRTSVKTVKRTDRKIKPGGGGWSSPVLSEGRDEDEKYGPVCPGCGVFMQDLDPERPGYYQEKKIAQETFSGDEEIEGDDDVDDIDMLLDGDEGEGEEEEGEGEGEEEEGFVGESEGEGEGEVEGSDGEEGKLDKGYEFDWSDGEEGKLDKGYEFDWSDGGEEGKLGKGYKFDWESDEWEKKYLGKSDDFEYSGFAPAGVGYGNITEETVKKMKKEKVSKSEKKRLAREAAKVKDEVTVCARCHSLRNYGQVKNPTAENLIPDFDFDRLISTRLVKPGNANSTVVVMVVDCVDFDGSFPKRASKSLFEALEGSRDDTKRRRLPKLVLVATKVDLLPSQISPTRLDRWVRQRARAGGAPKLSGVYMVSSRKDLGIRNLLSFIKDLAGPRGNVWIIGAQNAGKSTLINAFAKKGEVKVTKLTEAPVPGTTLGILRIGGILSAKAKMYDTPGLLHPYLMCMRLNREEQKMVEIRKELQPRSYRILPGQSIHVGGLMRLDLIETSVTTIYVTVWASPNVSLHMGKTENADELWKNNIGVRLQPPASEDRASELGKWEGRKIKVSGESWDVNSVDVAVAGFGWFSFGLKGTATLTLWMYEGIETTVRDPLVLDRAKSILRPGFLLPKAVSDALRDQNKLEDERKKRLEKEEEDEDMDSFLEVSV